VGLLTISASLTAHKKEGYLLPKLCLHCNRNFILRYLRETMTLALVIRRSLLLRTKWARPRNAATTEKEPSPSASPTQYTHTQHILCLRGKRGVTINEMGCRKHRLKSVQQIVLKLSVIPAKPLNIATSECGWSNVFKPFSQCRLGSNPDSRFKKCRDRLTFRWGIRPAFLC